MKAELHHRVDVRRRGDGEEEGGGGKEEEQEEEQGEGKSTMLGEYVLGKMGRRERGGEDEEREAIPYP